MILLTSKTSFFFFSGEESAGKKVPVIVEVGKKSTDLDKECEEVNPQQYARL